jgi:hypothetical protein
MNQNNKPDWIILSIVTIVITMFIGMGLGDYLSYLSTKQKNETIRVAICKDWSVEQIQGLINSK